jgi:hypothetical protein
MEEMGDDEVMAMLGSLATGLYAAGLWYMRGFGISRLGAPPGSRTLLLVLPLIALAGLWRTLASFAALDVREDARYQFLFVAMGTIWVFVLPRALSFIGVSYRDDALERRNQAAATAIAGTVAGLGILFAGSNMGEGPSIWNTVETAIAATALLFAAVLVLALVTRVGDTIAIERDLSSGVRFAGWIAASGVVLGRASAGDWAGTDAMLADLTRIGWPVAVLLVFAVALELTLRPKVSAPQPSVVTAGVVPALGFVAVSLAYVAYLPHWSE